MVGGRISKNDLEMLATDLSEAIEQAREEYAPDLPDVGPLEVLAALPEFLAALTAQAEGS
jgi:hypothetical protein